MPQTMSIRLELLEILIGSVGRLAMLDIPDELTCITIQRFTKFSDQFAFPYTTKQIFKHKMQTTFGTNSIEFMRFLLLGSLLR